MTKPIRLQLSRKPGFRLQAMSQATNGLPAKSVTRGTRHGNPFKIEEVEDSWSVRDIRSPSTSSWFPSERQAREFSIHSFRGEAWRKRGKIKAQLAGFNLACTCPSTYPDGSPCPCHADVLLELANR